MDREELLRRADEALKAGDSALALDLVTAAGQLEDPFNSLAPPESLAAQSLPFEVPTIGSTGPTIGDVSGAGAPDPSSFTLADVQNAALTRDQQNVASAPNDVVTLPGIGTITRVPGAGGSVFQQFGNSDVLGNATGTDGNAQIRNLFGSFDQLLTGFDTDAAETLDLLERTRAGEFDERFSNPAFQNVRVARNLEEAQAIREEGLIPIAARDAELIRQIGQEQAEQLRADAEQALAVRQGESRAARFQQIAAGIGNAFSSGINRSAIGTDQNQRLTALADQARSNVLQGVENRRAARAQAGQLDARSRLDAMLAENEAVQQLQNLMVQDASNAFRLRFEEENRLQGRLLDLEDNRRRLEANRPAFLSQLVQLANANNQRGAAQFIQDRAQSQRSVGLRNANQVVASNAALVAQNAKAVVDRAVNSRGIFTGLDEQAADAEIERLLGSVAELNQLAGELNEKGLLAPEVARLREQVVAQVQPLISQLGSSNIVNEEGVRVERNDRGIGFTKDFGKIGAETQAGIHALVEGLGGLAAPPVSLVGGQNSSTLSGSASQSQSAQGRADALFADF